MSTEQWNTPLMQILTKHGIDAKEVTLTPLSGGSISPVWKAGTTEGDYLVKIGEVPAMLEKEAEGLQAISSAEAIPVPHIYGSGTIGEEKAEALAYIVMSYVQGSEAPDTAERLGRGVAGLHARTTGRFGYGADNYIGRLSQPNAWTDNWVAFLRTHRLGHQLELAIAGGHMPGERRERMERLLDRLDQWIPTHPSPSLLHGDLWRGNWIVGPGGQPYLIDPAVYYGDAEMELAFTELFSGFPERFYEAYREVRPFDQQRYAERRPLYQLYYLLVHLNHFGESYGPAVDRVLARYAG